MREQDCEGNRRKLWGKRRLPELKTRWRLLLYSCTVFACALSAVSLRADSFPVWLEVPVDAAAFCGLFLSLCYAVPFLRRGVRNAIRAAAEKYSFLNGLCSSYRRRTFLFAAPGCGLNVLFAGFNAAVGIVSWSAWYLSLAAYYFLLCLMRAALLRHEFLAGGRRDLFREWKLYSRCGALLIGISVALCGVVILMVKKGYGYSYPGYLIYVVALYVFVKVISATASALKARKMKSPLVSGLKNVGYADALVSMLSLQTAMFASFGQEDPRLAVRMNTLTGAFVCAAVVSLGILMVLAARKRTAEIKERAGER